jgi:allantoin racemase
MRSVTMKIRVITPSTVREKEARTFEQYSAGARHDTEISVSLLERGPASVDSLYEEAMAVADTVKKIGEAEQDGIHAVIANCMLDPGVRPGRERVSIPVLGPAETSMRIAAMLGHNFSVVTILEGLVPAFEDYATILGLRERLASVRAVNMHWQELEDHDRLVSAIVEQSVKAVRDDGAHIIVLGCTAMRSLASDVEAGLRKHGIADVPVIDPALVVLKVAEALVDMGLSHSKRSYPDPWEQVIIGY